MSRTAIRPLHVVIVTAAIALATPWFAAADESALQRCGAIEDAESRLECYDELAKQSPPEETPPAAKEAEKGAEKEDQGAETFTAEVTRCEEAHDGKYFFFFDNGQVWKQVKTDRERYRDCSFTVTVTRDWFGYKMQRDGEQRRIRISRVK